MAGSTDPDLGAITGDALRRVFDAPAPLTVGLEEEVMLLDPETFDLAPVAPAALERVADEARFKAELPAAQVEIVVPPCEGPAAALRELARGRNDLARALDGIALPAAAGVHPFAAGRGELSAGERYDLTHYRYATIAERQLVASIQVHVAVGGAELTLAVYNALRAYLPEIAALAANAPFHERHDTGLASVRPTIAVRLPRQGLPPAISSWDRFAAELRWGAAAGSVDEPRQWWWELRPHITFGTLEVRVPDAQTTLADTAGVVAFVHALIAWLRERAEAGEALLTAPTWRIAENRWAAIRHGVEGELADLVTGERLPTRERLEGLLDELEPLARVYGTQAGIAEARRLVRSNGAMRQREHVRTDGFDTLTPALAKRFTDALPAGIA